jgi:hypothetical protein
VLFGVTPGLSHVLLLPPGISGRTNTTCATCSATCGCCMTLQASNAAWPHAISRWNHRQNVRNRLMSHTQRQIARVNLDHQAPE